jgi:RNA polymerase sigma factor (sigma-70 family)
MSHLKFRYDDRADRADQPITSWLHRFDNAAIVALMNYYRPLLKTIAGRNWDQRLQGQVDLSETLHQTWATVALQIPKKRFTNRAEFCAYLTRSLCNQLVSYRRYLLVAKKRSVGCEVRSPDPVNMGQAIRSQKSLLPVERVIEKELAKDTLDALLRLPRELQHLMRWRFRHGMTYREIGEKLGRSEDEVRHLVNYCIKLIRKDLRRKYQHEMNGNVGKY